MTKVSSLLFGRHGLPEFGSLAFVSIPGSSLEHSYVANVKLLKGVVRVCEANFKSYLFETFQPARILNSTSLRHVDMIHSSKVL